VSNKNKEEKSFSVDGMIVIVTGAGRGNGYSIADGLSRLGGKVFGLDIRFEKGECSFAQIECDITNEEALKSVISMINKAEGRIDGLVNNAGITMSPENCYSRNTFEKTISVNTLAPLRLSWMLAELMKKQGKGSIVNITSLGAHLGFPDNPAYQASKAALSQITKSMAMDYGSCGIRVNSVCPGYIVTQMTQASFDDPEKRKERQKRMMLNRWGRPEDLVGPCAFLLSDASEYVTGAEIPVDGGWLAKGF